MGHISSVLGFGFGLWLTVADVKLKDWEPVDIAFRSYRSIRQFIADQAERPRPLGAGIDCPLAFSTGEEGWRPCDSITADVAVQAGANPAEIYPRRGLLTTKVEGVILALALRQQWPDLPITETESSTLMMKLGEQAQANPAACEEILSDLFKLPIQKVHPSDLAVDAELNLLGAVASAAAIWNGLSGAWSCDLHRTGTTPPVTTLNLEANATALQNLDEPAVHWSQLFHPAGPVHFFWPSNPAMK